MSVYTGLLLIVSVTLSACAQLLLKAGVSHRALALSQLMTSPWLIGGIAAYFASAVVWLAVLSKVDVSQAYPCVALAFVLTVLGGHFFLGEPVSLYRMIGLALILSGVVMIGLFR